MYFASTTLPELATVLGTVFGGFGVMLVGFYKYAQAREKDFAKSREMTAEAYSKSNEKLGHALDRVATASERAAVEAEKRNGHLAELTIEARKDVLAAINYIIKQEVKEQVVKHQTVNEKE